MLLMLHKTIHIFSSFHRKLRYKTIILSSGDKKGNRERKTRFSHVLWMYVFVLFLQTAAMYLSRSLILTTNMTIVYWVDGGQ